MQPDPIERWELADRAHSLRRWQELDLRIPLVDLHIQLVIAVVVHHMRLAARMGLGIAG